MNKTISIIIPSYNMENYIGQNLNSLLIPSINDAEIIIVNDGSNDKTSEIAHRYSEKYPGSIRVIDKENGHYGSCINRGLKEASGKYIKILDADDSFDTANFELFVNFLKAQDADLVLSDFSIVDGAGVMMRHYSFPTFPVGSCLNFDVALQYLSKRVMQMHAMTYKTSVLLDMNYSQTQGIPYTDTEWAFYPMFHIRDVSYFDSPVYKYRTEREGQSMEIGQFMKSINIVADLFERRLNFYLTNKNSFSSVQRQFADSQLSISAGSLYHRVILGAFSTENINRIRKCDSSIVRNCPDISMALNEVKASSLIPVKFIKHWRNDGFIDRIIVGLVRAYYRFRKVY